MAELEKVMPEKAVELQTPEGHQYALVALHKDGHVTVCILPEAVGEPHEAVCRTSRRPEGKILYYMAQAWLSSLIPGTKVVKVHEEGEED